MSRVNVEIVEATDALEALAPDWWDLWRRIPGAPPFLCPAWLIPWWRHFAPGRLFVMAARRDGPLVGLAAFYIECGTLGRRLLPLGISLSDHLDILVDPKCSEPALTALALAAWDGRADWDAWELEELPPQAAALSLQLPRGATEEIARQSSCPVLLLPEDADAPDRLLPKAKRANIATARNRAARRGAASARRASGADVGAAFAALARLHNARWRRDGKPGLLEPGPALDFHREAVLAMEAAGLARIYSLSIGERVVAVHYGIQSSRRHLVYLLGYDPDFAFESPGVILTAHAIGQAAAEGCREIDFLRGREAYKYGWGAVDRWNVKRSIRHRGHG